MQKLKNNLSGGNFCVGEESQNDFEKFRLANEEDKTRDKMIKELSQLSSNNKKMLVNFQKEILKCKHFSMQTDLNNIINLIREYILKINCGIDDIVKLQSLDDVVKGSKKLKQDINEIKEKLNMWLLSEQKKQNLDHLFEALNNENIQIIQDQESKCEEWKSKQLVISNFLIRSDKIQVNNNNTLLFSSFGDQISVYGFNGNRKLIKILTQHQGQIKNLLCLNIEQLLSMEYNSNIIIWNNNWQPYQILKDEQKQILCLITNIQDDFIVGGHQYIDFWKRTIFLGVVCKLLILNLEETKLISSGISYGEDSNLYHIYLIEFINEKWVKIQTFNTNKLYYERVFLADNDSFVFINRYLGTISTFNYDPQTEQLIRTQLLEFQSLGQWIYSNCQYFQQTNTLVTNHKCFVYFIILDQKRKNQIIKKIEFQRGYHKITVSEKGNYLIQQNYQDFQVKILKLKNKY